ncbi:hypothetical protein ACFZDM_18225 [Streptomyces californicus]|uniref:hypothetical protein n=1 Tax=Streptomyces californicus TaxID=67351 RepID=UPI0036F02035
MLTQVLVGIVEGALAEAAQYTREISRPWPASGPESAVDDPHILVGYGHLDANLCAAQLLADKATRAFSDADAAGLSLTSAERGRAALAVSAAKGCPGRLCRMSPNVSRGLFRRDLSVPGVHTRRRRPATRKRQGRCPRRSRVRW